MTINICKECGKSFEASSSRVSYCSDIHYRPCPVCGTLVEAKYLSDPPRRCAKCKSSGLMKAPSSNGLPKLATAKQLFKLDPLPSINNTKAPQPEQPKPSTRPSMPKVDNSNVHVMQGEDARVFTGTKEVLGFKIGHVYAVTIEKKDFVYEVSASRDLTTDEDIDLMIPTSSMISLGQMFSPFQQA